MIEILLMLPFLYNLVFHVDSEIYSFFVKLFVLVQPLVTALPPQTLHYLGILWSSFSWRISRLRFSFFLLSSKPISPHACCVGFLVELSLTAFLGRLQQLPTKSQSSFFLTLLPCSVVAHSQLTTCNRYCDVSTLPVLKYYYTILPIWLGIKILH